MISTILFSAGLGILGVVVLMLAIALVLALVIWTRAEHWVETEADRKSWRIK